MIYTDEYIRKTVAWNLRKALYDRGLTQTAFAKQIGVQRGRVARWVNGYNCPEWNMVPVICSVLDCDPAFLVTDHYKSAQ